MDWAQTEMAGIDLGDVRLNNRTISVLKSLGDKPTVNIPGAFNGWDETKAAYRLFDNEKVTGDKILAPHGKATLERMKSESVILHIQDTTELDYSGQSEKSASGYLNSESRLGLYLHAMIVTTPERVCLGAAKIDLWRRDKLKNQMTAAEKKAHNKLPIKEKESYRWIQGYQIACKTAEYFPEKRVVTIGDRESDIYELFLEAENKARDGLPHSDWLIRATGDRAVDDDELENERIRNKVGNSPILGEIEFTIPPRDKKPARKVRQSVQAMRVTIHVPYHKAKKEGYRAIAITAVFVKEIDPPDNVEPVEWLLLTNIELTDDLTAFQIIEWYLCRWDIEMYFKIFKSGCNVEKLQLDTMERMDACLSLYMVVAWRIFFITVLGRKCPDLPCDVVFHDFEWKSVYAINKKTAPPEKPPSLNEMITMVAKLGGFLARKSDGFPGSKVMWIGMQRMRDFALAWETSEMLAQQGGTYG